jgi:hypothetical protein
VKQAVHGFYYDYFEINENNRTDCLKALQESVIDSMGDNGNCKIDVYSISVTPLYGPIHHEYLDSTVLLQYSLFSSQWIITSKCSLKQVMEVLRKNVKKGIFTSILRKKSWKFGCKSSSVAYSIFSPDYNDIMTTSDSTY